MFNKYLRRAKNYILGQLAHRARINTVRTQLADRIGKLNIAGLDRSFDLTHLERQILVQELIRRPAILTSARLCWLTRRINQPSQYRFLNGGENGSAD